MTNIIYYLLSITLISANIDMKIYNQGWALIQEERIENFATIQKQNMTINNLPLGVQPQSINLFSDQIEFLSKEFIFNPISLKTLLDANINNQIELVKYDDNGAISQSIMAKLISNNNIPIFEIYNKISINPPFNYLFDNIPENITTHPFLNCVIQNTKKQTNYILSYFTDGISWTAEYNIFINNNNSSSIEGWYLIKNSNNLNYNNINISLISGPVNFEINKQTTNSFNAPKNARSSENHIRLPNIKKETQNYYTFKLNEKNNLNSNSEIRYKFFDKKNIPYKYTYTIYHSLKNRHFKKHTDVNKIPAEISLEVLASNIGNFQIPEGLYSIYKKDKALTYVGASIYGISSKNDTISLPIGQSEEILSSFTITGHEINKDKMQINLNAIFENQKDEYISLKWIEQISNSTWDIIYSNYKYIKKDAYHIEFNINIPPNSIEEVNLQVTIDQKRY